MMKTKNSFSWLALFAVASSLVGTARAQEAVDDGDGGFVPNGAAGGAGVGAGVNAGSRVYVAEENALTQLPGVLRRGGGPGAVSLRAGEEAFTENAAARDALLAWVRGGGVVFLHTGAARAFGFVTVEARAGSNQVAGQLFGRARAALPFGSHPLLMESGPALGGGGAPRRPNSDPTLLPGVNVVFYEMQPGDHLVESHPAGTPLLQVADLAANVNAPLFASAIAPFGRGWAIFTPDSVDQRRGDGATFARNLLNFVSPARGGRVVPQWVSVPARVVENGAATELRQALLQSLRVPSSPALPALGTTPAPNAAPVAEEINPQNRALGVAPVRPPARPPAAPAPVAPPQNGVGNADGNAAGEGDAEGALAETDQTGLVLTRAEATSYAALLARGGQGADAASNLLQARLALSRGDAPAATRALEVTEGLLPNSAEVALWRGLILAGTAQEVNQPSPVRARLLGDAARQLEIAAEATSLLPAAGGGGGGAGGIGGAGGNGNGAMDMAMMMGPNIGGIPTATIGELAVRFGQIAQVFALEPPLVQQFGIGDAAITVRAVASDTSLRLVIPSAQALANARNFGWRGDREEILLFPTPDSFLVYRQALGLNTATVPLPAGGVGDVVGQRILMVAVPALPVVQAGPNGGTRIVATRNASGNILARLHSYVLLNALDEGGANVPAWLQLGIENLVNGVIAGDPQFVLAGQSLAQAAQAGGLLTPDQFSLGAELNPLAQAQAAAILTFFYNEHGAGGVVETLQRLGAGQTPDEAVQATTGGDVATLFQNWRTAQFGIAPFPNGGPNG
jgi:hypothetical protein